MVISQFSCKNHETFEIRVRKAIYPWSKSKEHAAYWSIRKLIETTWKESDTDSVLTKINQVRRKLIEWAKEQAAATREHISSHQALLEQALSELIPENGRIKELKTILETVYAEEEEAFWRQRSRIQWLNGGDRSDLFPLIFPVLIRN